MAIHKTRRQMRAVAAATLVAAAMAGGATAIAAPTAHGTNPNTGADTAQTGVDSGSAIIELSAPPLTTAAKTKPSNGKRLDFNNSAVKNQRAQLSKQRNDFKAWLRKNAPGAKVTGEYDVALNAVAVQLNGTSLDTLRSAPNVVHAGYEGLYTPAAHEDPDLALIDGAAGWAAAGASDGSAGSGVQVAIIDTGIDVTHPCFDDAGFPATTQLGDKRFTNNKVIVAKVFANKAANLGYSAEAVQDHGTHVAGTVACDVHTPASVNGADISYDPSGVAPGAQLGNYNIFPGDIENARSEDILDALQAAAEDGMDVMNMSLGGGAHGVQDLLTKAVDNLDRANYVVAVAAGNEGPGHYTVSSPGSAERALTAGASSVGHFVGLPVTATGFSGLAATGDFATPASDLTAELAMVGTAPDLGTGCAAGDYGDMTGKIALISRGACSFGTKIQNAQDAGAAAAIVVNNVAGDPTAMGGDGVNNPTIPAVMASLKDKAALVNLVGQQVTIGSVPTYMQTGNDDIMAGFSSQGPTDVDFRVKPDVVAPGVNVLSSIPQSFCDPVPAEGCWAFFQGTSMATPHLAGMAAVVRAAHPDWSAEQVRSAIVNTADQGRLTQSGDGTTLETDANIIGSGIADLASAIGAKVSLSSVSTSFGAVPSGSGQTRSAQVTVTDLSGAAQTLALGVTGDPAFSVSPASISVPANGSATFTVTFSAGKGATTGDHQATLTLGDAAHSVLYAFVK